MKIAPCQNYNIAFKSAKKPADRVQHVKTVVKENKKTAVCATGAVILGAVLCAFANRGAIKGAGGKILLKSPQVKLFKKQMKEFPKDVDYRKKLLAAMNIKTDNYALLRPVVGPDEYKYILKEFNSSPEYYSPGKELITKVKDGFDMSGKEALKYRATMHMHTTHSDGRMTVKELLDQSAEYADKIQESFAKLPKKDIKAPNAPFTVAITDHDTFEGCKEAVKIISSDPWKYRNIRVILGCELSAANRMIPQELKKTVPIHMLIHNINPFDETFNKFLADKKPNVNLVNTYIDMSEAMELVKKQDYGFMGIAHPALTGIGDVLKKPEESMQAMSDLFRVFKEKGGDRALFSEVHYHYFGAVGESREWLNSLNSYAKNSKLYFSGGLDSHGKSIFYSDR